MPDAPGELADAVTALRLATAAPVAAGPVLFERLDWRPYGIRPVLPIAATAPPGEPTRLDPFRASVAVQLRPKLALADDDTGLGDALDRWELALFQDDPFRAEQLRQALGAALGDGDGTWAAGMRAAALLGETRAGARRPRRPLPRADARPLRRLLVAVLLHGDRAKLLRELDDTLLGVRAKAASASQSCARADTSRAASVETWRRRTRCSHDSSGSRRSTASARRLQLLLPELRALVREAEAWARRERDPAAEAAACSGATALRGALAMQ